MDGLTLELIMRTDPHTSKLFEGVFAADTLPRRLNKNPALVIMNVDVIKKPGSHWQAVFIDKNGKGEFFCSYGLPPFVSHHRNFLNRVCKSWKYNPVSLQALDSTVCGHYCLLYLIHKSHGYSLNDFVNMYFDENADKNDAIVKFIVDRYSTHRIFCDDFVINGNKQRCTERRK